jgi:hypothetical protein
MTSTPFFAVVQEGAFPSIDSLSEHTNNLNKRTKTDENQAVARRSGLIKNCLLKFSILAPFSRCYLTSCFVIYDDRPRCQRRTTERKKKSDNQQSTCTEKMFDFYHVCYYS